MSASSVAVATAGGVRGGAERTSPTGRAAHQRHVHGRWVDFLTLGGGSLFVIAALAAFYPREDTARAALATTALALAFVLTYPHVAHSYQLFYRGFARKAFGAASPLALRYRLAGVAAPAAMAAFFAFVLFTGNLALLGIAGNVTLLARAQDIGE